MNGQGRWLGCILAASLAFAADGPFRLERAAVDFDRGEVGWHTPDGAPPATREARAKDLAGCGGILTFDFTVPGDGWYELVIEGGSPAAYATTLVDGELLCAGPQSPEDVIPGTPVRYKRASLFLRAGAHALTLKQLHHRPSRQPDAWSLTAVDGQPGRCLQARVVGHDILRRGEPLVLDITAGTTIASTYELVVRGGQAAADWQKVGEVAFAAGRLETRRVSLTVDGEGVYEIRARIAGERLRPADLMISRLAVVDTTPVPASAAEPARTLLHDIDCVAQTDRGQPLVTGTGYWEANGATRISTSPAGTYRETADNLGPAPLMSAHGDRSLAAFSYATDVEHLQVPHLVEVDYPDDERRTANIIVLEDVPDKPGQFGYCQAQPGGGYETGDWHRLSGTMQTNRMVFWPSSRTVRIAVVSMHEGMRAAAARIRVHRLDGGLPLGSAGPADGRMFASYFEEPGRWKTHMRSGLSLFECTLAEEFTGIERWCQMARHSGQNALWPTELIYQQATYRSRILDGWNTYSHDVARLVALLAEKYGLRYIPEIHLSRPQGWYYERTLRRLVKETPGSMAVNRFGQTGTYRNTLAPYFNALHPEVQQVYLDVVGELVDKVSDTRSYAGFSSRLMSWAGCSWNTLVSLNWGYDDWTFAQFRADTGFAVPAGAGDNDGDGRFARRHEALAGEARESWQRWRAGRMLTFFRRIRERIRQGNPKAVLFLKGFSPADADQTFGNASDDPADVAMGMGIDLRQLAAEPGIALVPGAGYGRAKSTGAIDDQKRTDVMLDPAYLATGMGCTRAFSFGNTYFEVHRQIAVERLGLPGLKPGNYCGAADAAGGNARERLAVVLAEQDTAFMSDGGLGYTFGQPADRAAWLAAYTALPAVAFESVAQARDPVAVWQHQAADGLYFYAVNREGGEITVQLDLEGTGAVSELATRSLLACERGTASITLPAYGLRSFRAAAGARLTRAVAVVPEAQTTLVRSRLAFAQQVWEAISGRQRDDVSEAQRTAFKARLDQAWQAFALGHTWRARVALSMAPVLAVFQQLDRWPDGQLANGDPGLLKTGHTSQYEPDAAPMITAEELLARAGGSAAEDGLAVRPLTDFAAALPGSVLWAAKGRLRLVLPAQVTGRYRLALGHLAAQPATATLAVNGRVLPNLVSSVQANRRERSVVPMLVLPAGEVTIELQAGGAFGIYGLVLEPLYRSLPDQQWSTIGPFATPWQHDWQPNMSELVRDGMLRADPPMQGVDLAATCRGAGGQELAWRQVTRSQGPHAEAGVNFLIRAGVAERHLGYAATWIDSPDERDAELWIGTDWWANAYLNGEPVTSRRDPKLAAKDGAQFNGWKPGRATIHLKAGRNQLLVRNHGGSAANWFTAFLTDPGDLRISNR